MSPTINFVLGRPDSEQNELQYLEKKYKFQEIKKHYKDKNKSTVVLTKNQTSEMTIANIVKPLLTSFVSNLVLTKKYLIALK